MLTWTGPNQRSAVSKHGTESFSCIRFVRIVALIGCGVLASSQSIASKGGCGELLRLKWVHGA